MRKALKGKCKVHGEVEAVCGKCMSEEYRPLLEIGFSVEDELKKVIAQRDALLAALKESNRIVEDEYGYDPDDTIEDEWAESKDITGVIYRSRAAIALTKKNDSVTP